MECERISKNSKKKKNKSWLMKEDRKSVTGFVLRWLFAIGHCQGIPLPAGLRSIVMYPRSTEQLNLVRKGGYLGSMAPLLYR